jgi:futalosine hydrolase
MTHQTNTLVLLPTELELRRIEELGGLPSGLGQLLLCGFGPVAAAARTAQLLAQHRPNRVLLLGIAGTYDPARRPVGTALWFQAAALHGVGVGEGAGFIDPPALGFPQWPGEAFAGVQSPRIENQLPLAVPGLGSDLGGTLLTTCAASANAAQVAERRRRFPAADAEDMEGFAVAAACALAGVPLAIVRGISNVVGDRDPKRWRIQGALEAAREVALRALAYSPWSSVK